MQFLEESKQIRFDSKEHRYFNKNGDELISVTKLLSLYKEPFDKDGSILINKAKKLGITPKELQKEWDQKKIDGASKGSKFHKEAEYYVRTGKILDDEHKDIIEQFSRLNLLVN